MQVVCCIASGGIVRGGFLQRPPSNAAGPLWHRGVGAKTRRRARCCAISIAENLLVQDIFFSLASLYYPSARKCRFDPRLEGGKNRSDSDTVWKTEAPAELILLSVHKTYTRLHAHRNNESIILPFLKSKPKIKSPKGGKKSILNKLFITLEKWILRTSLILLRSSKTSFFSGLLLSPTADGTLS